jgi:hypothetical protein
MADRAGTARARDVDNHRHEHGRGTEWRARRPQPLARAWPWAIESFRRRLVYLNTCSGPPLKKQNLAANDFTAHGYPRPSLCAPAAGARPRLCWPASPSRPAPAAAARRR